MLAAGWNPASPNSAWKAKLLKIATLHIEGTFGQIPFQTLYDFCGNLDWHQIRIREIAIVMGVLFTAQRN